jgi:hypothetical protein
MIYIIMIVAIMAISGVAEICYEYGKKHSLPATKFNFKVGDRIIGTKPHPTTGDRSFMEYPLIIKKICSHHIRYEYTMPLLGKKMYSILKEDIVLRQFVKADF